MIDLDELEAEIRGPGMLNGGIIMELIARLRAAEVIVRDLASQNRTVATGHGESGCFMCGAPPEWPGEHMESCLIRRAKEYVAG